MAITNYFSKVNNGVLAEPAQLNATKEIVDTTASLTLSTGWPVDATDGPIHISIFKVGTDGAVVSGTVTYWKATLSGTTLSDMTLKGGTNQAYDTGDSVIVLSPYQFNDMVEGILEEHKQDGTHSNVTADSIVVSGTVTANEFIVSGSSSDGGWIPGLPAPNTVTANGNRSYDLVFNGTNLTDTVSPGMRLRTTRTVTAPTRCTSLNGTNQYYSKSSPAGAAQTDDITAFGWVKPSSNVTGVVISKTGTPGTNGWRFYMDATGQVYINGAGRYASSYQSLPLNKWSHVAASIDMSANTAQIYIDGIAVPTSALGSSGSSWTNAGNIEVGSNGGGAAPFSGKLAQVGFSSSVLSAANVRLLYSQGITAAIVASHSIVSAYSFDNSINDLNTTNANNLTANGSAVATNADSPFSINSFGTATGTTDYAIVTKAVFSTNTTLTVQVPEGCTIPTSGGVSAVAYSTQKAPYGMPSIVEKFRLITLYIANISTGSIASSSTVAPATGGSISIPIGAWKATVAGVVSATASSVGFLGGVFGLSTATNSFSNPELTALSPFVQSAATDSGGSICRVGSLSLASATTHYLVGKPIVNNTNLFFSNTNSSFSVSLENAYL